ncbi:hypothetical protein D3C76_1612430 [compost metagenome]
MGHCPHRSHVAEEFDVGRGRAKTVVADHGSDRFATKLAKARCVDMFIKPTAGDIGGILKIVE